MSTNDLTLQSYELGVEAYTSQTASEVSGDFMGWIDEALKLLPQNARIIEIGSAFGRDAHYIESQGFQVQRTDATEGFVNMLQEKGYPALHFNVLLDDFTSTYDLIFANAVFLHFTPQELQVVLGKIHKSLTDTGVLAFSVKKGVGEEWTSAKVGHPRYFCYWSEERLRTLLDATGFKLVAMRGNKKFLLVIANRQIP